MRSASPEVFRALHVIGSVIALCVHYEVYSWRGFIIFDIGVGIRAFPCGAKGQRGA